MQTKSKYYVVRERALPEVLMKVVEAKKLLDRERSISIQEATERAGISRSSFYKYKDDIFPFHETAKGRTITFIVQIDDSPGFLSGILEIIAKYRANILTIHQSIPVNDVAMITLSTEVREGTDDTSRMIEEIEAMKPVHYVKIVARG